jgi:hypothetical protein
VSRFLVLRSRTRFQRYRACRDLFSCFALPNPFSTVPKVSGPVFTFCAPRLGFGGTEGVGFRFHVLRSRTHFRRYRGRRDSFSCFALSNLFLLVLRASVPVFMSCATGLFFGGNDVSGFVYLFCAPRPVFVSTERVGSRFLVLCSRTHFRRYRRCLVLFSCFALPDPFLAIPTASVTVFLFCAIVPIFGGTDRVGSRLHVLRTRTRFRWYRVRRFPFTYFALPDPL